ncbi:Atp-binding protein [Globisporangium polare]
MTASDAPILQATDSATAAAATAAAVDEVKSRIAYTSGKELMAQGSHALHEHVASKLEAALGRALPQMEVRVSNLSLAAEIAVASNSSSSASSSGAKKPRELPTLTNELKKGLAGLVAKKQSVRKDILKNVTCLQQ